MDYEAAREQGEARLRGPRAESAFFDPACVRLVIRLTDGAVLELVPSDVQGLERATPAELAEIELEPFGLALHFPKLNADLYVPALAQGVFGSASWMADRARRRPPADL
ncbi:DUF2442 domain-containing protein (plasmid) [Xanthobacter dioxanivorans]|uniref:DUF2442 domain-containing protein n=1 Tax=Xanthobacter dioxanivorans TaxID=2528964 RepID=A0A974SLP0_9HYPH|nr:DUF2442 domain-containing protein [Xanthobacter dioxanivorans]QRG10120.1 DUF2442 domain-containing protein [Xanthobacter dioxanivorans]